MLNEFQYAFRLLRRSPGFATAAVLTLALGIGVNTAIYSVLQAVWIDAVPFADPSRLVVLYSANDQMKKMAVSEEDFDAWREQNTVFESLGATDHGGVPSLNGRRVAARWASPGLFATLDARMWLGRPLLPADGEPSAPIVAVLSYDAWQRGLHAAPDVVGRKFDSEMGPVEIVGVAPPDFRTSVRGPDLWVSKRLVPPMPGRTGGRSLEVVGRLKPGVDPRAASDEMNAIASRLAAHHPEMNRYPRVSVWSIRDNLAGAGVGESLWLLLGATAAVLLIGCANIANLFLARGASRRRELAVRTAVGARPVHHMRQILCESTLVAAAGTVAGLLLTVWARDAIVAAMPPGLHRSSAIAIDGRVLGVTLLAGVLSALLTGLLPAARSTLVRPLDLLAGSSGQHGSTRARRRLAASLIGAQVALAVVVLSAAGLLLSSFVKLRSVDAGFAPEGLLTFQVTRDSVRASSEDTSRALHRQILDALATIPQIEAASAAEMLPLSGNRARYAYRVGGDATTTGRQVTLDQRTVAVGYFEALGIPLKEGKSYTANDNPPGGVIVNEQAARELWPGAESAIGRELFNGTTRLTVIGVVGNVRHLALDAEPVAEIYRLSAQSQGMTYIVRTAGSPAALARTVRHTLEAAAPVRVEGFETYDELVTQSVRGPQFRARLFSLMGLLVCGLAMVGIFSVTAYAVAERQREIGIRMALGADPARTVRLMMAQAAVPVLAGLLAGVTAAFNTNQLVAHFLFATTPRDATTVLGVLLGVLFTAMLAAYIPARRAMRVDPTNALRAE